ncbi:MAG: formate dehydrogenase accessory protein FdhE [Burkholderiales bacterium]|nr:formate dehydrogenase accessory protein FdhE [Burkholderiales bacterium]
MSTTATVRVQSAEEIASRAGGSTPPLRWPERTTFFAERAMRLRQLANGHAMGDFLLFAARLAQAQQAALERLGANEASAGGGAGGVPIPDAEAIDRASLAGQPPLAATDWPRDRAWHAVLRGIVRAMRAETAPGPAADALARLDGADEVFLERQADALLTGVMAGLDLATAPVVAAALQVLWTHMAIELERAHAARGQTHTLPVGKLDDAGICPCCGSRPVASVTRSAGDVAGQRYLHCSLCGTEWNVPRGRCVHCGEASAEKVAYQSLDRADVIEPDEDSGARAARASIQAETCDACGHYLKIVHGDRDPMAEPVADDLASITLDLLVAETGKLRHGVNMMLLFGDPDEAPVPPPRPPAPSAPPGGR